MSITLQARQADGTWSVRNAFVTENAKVRTGAMTADDLETQARRVMAQWQSTSQDGKQLRVHNSAKDPKPSRRNPAAEAMDSLDITKTELDIALNIAEGDGPAAEDAHQLVRYCRGQIFHRDMAVRAARSIRNGEFVQ